MRRILVSGASGIVGYGILRSLQNSGMPLFLVGTSIYDDSVAPAFCDVFELAAPSNDPGYVEWLLSAIRKHRIDMLIPGLEIDVYTWVEHVREIEGAGAMPLLNVPALIGLCKDKWNFYQRLTEAGMRCAIDTSLEQDFAALKDRFGLPFLLKPRRGFGAKGIVRVDGPETFLKHRLDIGPVLMAQPIVGNDEEEYTTSAFCDGRGGYFAGMTLRRKLSRDGYTDKAEVVGTGDFSETIVALCRHFRPLGPTNFQFRMCGDGPKLLEINPRISSSTSIRAAFGYNESAMAVDYFLERRTPCQPAIRRGKAVRYTDEQIFYEDSIHL
jgi:carbamoyl-phosphate synthase large subunit